MMRSFAIAVLLAIALGYVIIMRRIEDEDELQDMGDYGPLPTAYRIGRVSAYIH